MEGVNDNRLCWVRPSLLRAAQAFAVCTLVFLLLFALLLVLRYRLASLEDRAEAASERLAGS